MGSFISSRYLTSSDSCITSLSSFTVLYHGHICKCYYGRFGWSPLLNASTHYTIIIISYRNNQVRLELVSSISLLLQLHINVSGQFILRILYVFRLDARESLCCDIIINNNLHQLLDKWLAADEFQGFSIHDFLFGCFWNEGNFRPILNFCICPEQSITYM